MVALLLWRRTGLHLRRVQQSRLTSLRGGRYQWMSTTSLAQQRSVAASLRYQEEAFSFRRPTSSSHQQQQQQQQQQHVLQTQTYSLQQHYQLQQRRHYLFLPTSWEELKLWMRSQAEKRTIPVQLRLRHNTNHNTISNSNTSSSKKKKKNLMSRAWKRLGQHHQKGYKYYSNYYYQKAMIRYRQGVARGKSRLAQNKAWMRTKGLKLQESLRRRRRAAILQSRSQMRARTVRMRRMFRSRTTRARNFFQSYWHKVPVVLQEYSQPDWFDDWGGRPLTSRDTTGRFVNPWQSETTGGVHSLRNIWNWRLARWQREYKQRGGLLAYLLPDMTSLLWQSQQTTTTKKSHHHHCHSAPSQSSSSTTTTAPLSGVLQQQQQEPPPPPLKDRTLRLTWIGHATCLVQYGNFTILTDPIFSNRASPFQHGPLIGMARDVPPSCTIDELPSRIDICLISHDHYDHLDKTSCQRLRERVQQWVVPLGIGEWLQEKCAVDNQRIVELEWWESVRLLQTTTTTTMHMLQQQQQQQDGNSKKYSCKAVERVTLAASPTIHPARRRQKSNNDRTAKENNHNNNNDGGSSSSSVWVTCCPSQHWSSRTFWDRNYRLWCSFAVLFGDDDDDDDGEVGATFYFGGDTALPRSFPLFEQVSDYIGSSSSSSTAAAAAGGGSTGTTTTTNTTPTPAIDLAALPIGAYEPDFFMRDAHVNPQEAVQIHQALQCRKSVGIHWGTFPLSEEPMEEPPIVLEQAAQKVGADFVTIPIGASIEVECPGPAAAAAHDDEPEEEQQQHDGEEQDDDDDDDTYEWIVE